MLLPATGEMVEECSRHYANKILDGILWRTACYWYLLACEDDDKMTVIDRPVLCEVMIWGERFQNNGGL
jgi:hypothetical protein